MLLWFLGFAGCVGCVGLLLLGMAAGLCWLLDSIIREVDDLRAGTCGKHVRHAPIRPSRRRRPGDRPNRLRNWWRKQLAG